MKIDLVKLVEEVNEQENIQGGINKIFALTCLQKLVDMQNEAINYTHCCKSDSEQLCECGGNNRVALDCTMKPCKHPKYYNK